MCIQNRFHDTFLAVYLFPYTDPHFKFTSCLTALCCGRARPPKVQTPSACSHFRKVPALLSVLLPIQAKKADKPTSLLFTPSSVLIPPRGAPSPHHNTGHSLCPQAVPSSSSKDESPKSWHHGDSSPEGEQSTRRPCMLAGILALLLPLSIYHHINIFYHKFC